MPLNPHARQCKGKSRRTGKPCRNPAVVGSDYCRLHGGGALGNRSRTGMPKPPGSGGPPPKGSQNARRHGVYSEHLTPEEQSAYEGILAGYIRKVHKPSAKERRFLERVAFLEAKWNTAAAANPPYRALNLLHRLTWNETESLYDLPRRQTPDAAGGKTPSEILYALVRRMYARIYTPLAVIDTET